MSGSVAPVRAIGLAYRIVLRQLVTRGRIAALLRRLFDEPETS